MKRLGICQKCGKETIIQDHHIYGYSEEYKDDVAPYCNSCDQKAHLRAKNNGQCVLSHEEIIRRSKNSYNRRHNIYKSKYLSWETMMPNIRLFENLTFNKNTQRINITSCFRSNNGIKLKVIKEK